MRRFQALLLVLLLTLPLGGCDLIGDVLEFGFWAIVVFVLLIVAIVWLIRKALSRRPPPTG